MINMMMNVAFAVSINVMVVALGQDGRRMKRPRATIRTIRSNVWQSVLI